MLAGSGRDRGGAPFATGTPETTVTEPTSHPLPGLLRALRLRVPDAERAARFFCALLGAESERASFDTHSEHRIFASSTSVTEIDVVLTDEGSAPAARLCFETPDPEAALLCARELGGSGPDVAHASDDQGVPLGFQAPLSEGALERPAPGIGALGVAIVRVPDTARAREFHSRLFGTTFQKVGAGDFWWVDAGPSMGIFPVEHDMTRQDVPREAAEPDVYPFFVVSSLDLAVERVRELGGRTLDRAALGHFQVWDCRDDQETAFGLWWDPGR